MSEIKSSKQQVKAGLAAWARLQKASERLSDASEGRWTAGLDEEAVAGINDAIDALDECGSWMPTPPFDLEYLVWRAAGLAAYSLGLLPIAAPANEDQPGARVAELAYALGDVIASAFAFIEALRAMKGGR